MGVKIILVGHGGCGLTQAISHALMHSHGIEVEVLKSELDVPMLDIPMVEIQSNNFELKPDKNLLEDLDMYNYYPSKKKEHEKPNWKKKNFYD